MDTFSNPYYPYTPSIPGYSPPPKQETVLMVNGWNGANACQMAPNSSKLALDTSGTMIWLIITDGAGYKTITPYDIFDHKDVSAQPQTPTVDLSAIEARLSRLEAFVNEFNTPTAPAVTVKPVQTAAQPTE